MRSKTHVVPLQIFPFIFYRYVVLHGATYIMFEAAWAARVQIKDIKPINLHV
jgi:hypothetical protein